MVEYVRAQPVAAESASDNVKECLLQMQTANIDLVKQIKELETERDTYAEAATTWAGRFHASKQKIDTLQAEAAKLREKLELLKGCWNDIKPLDCRKEDFEQRLFDDRQKRVLAFNNAILAIEKEKPNELVE
jgi:predicted nuclease with TOPRIM domain